MGVLLRLALGAITAAAAITSAGCRQLFGIDDTQTQTETDAPNSDDDADPRDPDASRFGPCRTDHFLCVDFDTADTGLSRLPDTSLIGPAVAEEQAASDAPSPPRILHTYAESSSATTGVVVAKTYLGGSLQSSTLSFQLKLASSGVAQTCDPLVFVITWVTGMMPAGTISLTVTDNKLVLTASTTSLSSQIMVSIERDRWVPIAVTFDYQTGHVELSAGLEGGLTSAPLSDLAPLDAAVGIGVVGYNDHGDCTADFDDFIIDAM